MNTLQEEKKNERQNKTALMVILALVVIGLSAFLFSVYNQPSTTGTETPAGTMATSDSTQTGTTYNGTTPAAGTGATTPTQAPGSTTQTSAPNQ